MCNQPSTTTGRVDEQVVDILLFNDTARDRFGKSPSPSCRTLVIARLPSLERAGRLARPDARSRALPRGTRPARSPFLPLSPSRLASVVMVLVNEIHELRVYRVGRNPLQLRTRPEISDDSRRADSPEIEPGALIAVDCVQPSRIAGSRHGPFLRLSNAYGWLFERKHGNVVAAKMPLEHGLWPYQVNNPLVGLALRSHPTTSNLEAWRYPGFPTVVYPHGHVVWADSRVHLDDVTFVRVQGTTGWLFTRRAGRDVLRELDPRDMSDAMAASGESSGAFAAFEGYEEGVERVDRESVRSSSFPSTSSAVLPELVPLRDIRACAKRHGLREKYHNDRSMVVSFVKDTGGGETARVDVYYATGTIATALHTPNAGKTQSFRRGCAIGDVDRIFADPRDAVGPGGYKRRREHDGAFSNNRAVRAMGVYLRDMAEATTEDEEVKLRGELRDLDAAMRELAKQRETLTDHLSAVEARSREGARLRMEGDLERHRELREQNLLARRGDRWTTTEAVHVSSPGLTRRCDFDFETVAHVALFSPGGWFLSRDGGGSQWENAPEEVRRIHAELRDGDWIEYVATGPEGQWYARAGLGFAWWGGERGHRFSEVCRDTRRRARRVAFGANQSWMVLFDDGRWESSGLCAELTDFIYANGTEPVEVSLGDDGAYFVRMADGDVDYALPDNCARAVRNLTEKGHVVKSVALAPRDTTFAWFIRYE